MMAASGQCRSSCIQQDFADVYFRFKKALSGGISYAKVNNKAERSSKRDAPDTLYRYPSLHRSACSSGRPITAACMVRVNPQGPSVAIGYHGKLARMLDVSRAIVASARTTMIGSKQCKRSRSFLQQWQYLVWQVASTTTWNAVSRAPVRAWWQQSYWAPTAQALWSSARPQACSATTQAYAVNLEKTASGNGRAISNDRRQGSRPAAVFCFGDER